MGIVTGQTKDDITGKFLSRSDAASGTTVAEGAFSSMH